MLAFVTSLRHPESSVDHARVERLLAESVSSWSRQSHSEFVIIVVANRDPRLDPALGADIVTVEFERPPQEPGQRMSLDVLRRDKGSKLAVGLIRARELGATHFMAVDADDFVSRRLAAYVAGHPDARGWTLADGWRINVERATVRREQGQFMRVCGSSHIVRVDEFPTPALSVQATQEELVDGFGEPLDRWLGSHMHVDLDLDLAELPFPGAMYRVGTGEAHSGNSLGGFGRPISRALAQEFGVQPTSRSPLALMRASLPSMRAVRERLPRLGR